MAITFDDLTLLQQDVLKYIEDAGEYTHTKLLIEFEGRDYSSTYHGRITEGGLIAALQGLDEKRLIRSRMEALTSGQPVYQITREGQLVTGRVTDEVSNSPPGPREEGSPSPAPTRSATSSQGLTALGQTVREWGKVLETFPAPPQLSVVNLTSDEVTSLCPVTGQPDWYTVVVSYIPNQLCIESKSFKLFLNSYRNEGLFVEAFATDVLNYVLHFVDPRAAMVTILQKPRGGVGIRATASFNSEAKTDEFDYAAFREFEATLEKVAS